MAMPEPRTWSIEYDVREDAERMFVPVELLPHAQPGDEVQMTCAEPPVTRRGRVVEREEDDATGEFVTVAFE
jgi:hypothetical protein